MRLDVADLQPTTLDGFDAVPRPSKFVSCASVAGEAGRCAAHFIFPFNHSTFT